MELLGRRKILQGKCTLSRRVKGIKSGNIYRPCAHWTLNVKPRSVTLACRLAGLLRVIFLDGTVVDPVSFPSFKNAFRAVLDQKNMGHWKSKPKMDEEILHECVDAIISLHDFMI